MKKCSYTYLSKNPAWLLALNLLLASSVFAQQTVTGVVKSLDDEELLPGVSVLVKGTQRGTITDLDGLFSLDASQGETLVFSFVGYNSKEVTIRNNSHQLENLLEPPLSDLNQVVVIGYGSQKKSDLTGEVATVKADVLQERPAASLNQALAGRLTGVNVSV